MSKDKNKKTYQELTTEQKEEQMRQWESLFGVTQMQSQFMSWLVDARRDFITKNGFWPTKIYVSQILV